MSDSRTMEPLQGDEAAIRSLLDRWGADDRFGERLASGTGVFLLLDATGAGLLHASEAAGALARGVSQDGRRVAPVLRIADQVGFARLGVDRPTLARIRFDPRGVAMPVTCTIVRTLLPDGAPVLLIAPSGPVPRLRPIASAASGSAVPAEPSATPVVESASPSPASPLPAAALGPAPTSGGTAPQRFVWRSDASGILVQISGPAAFVLHDALIARSWRNLSESGVVLDGQGLLTALDLRRTFRAVPIALVRHGIGAALDLEISGSPLDRTGGGFGGFGIIRAPSDDVPADDGLHESRLLLARIEPAITPETGVATDDVARSEAEAWVEDAALDRRPDPPRAVLPDPHLSSHEHDAFREIARALGARFAGDDVAPASVGADAESSHSCAVMPFPTPGTRSVAESGQEPDAAVVATLERLPTGVLVYRGDTILFANGPLLGLAGYEDFDGLASAGGLGRLFRGVVPHERADDEVPAILTTRDGRSLGVDIQRSAIDWGGVPAELLLARDAAPGEALRQRHAAVIADDFMERRGADALGVLEVIDDGIVTLDGNGRILGLNRAAATMLGLDPREVVGASFLSLFATENAVDVLASLHGVAGPADTAPSEVREVAARSRSGGQPLQIRVLPLPEKGRNRMCAVIRDVTTTRRIEAEALNARRAADAANDQKSDFLAKVSHEIRTPIGGILGLADLMLAEQFGPLGSERYRGYLGNIREAGTHVLELVDDLLDLARIEAGRLDLTVTEIPLNELVSRCVALLQPQAARDRIVLRTSFSDDLGMLMADERSVRQAALNVIANAIAFTEAGGQVIVSTTMADRGEIALRVRDTGIGMTPDEVETALQPFRRVALAAPRKGTGLGLPLTKALVEANHGRFRIASRKNEGTLVEMLFPVDSAVRSA